MFVNDRTFSRCISSWHIKACFVVPRLVAGQVKARACNALCGEMIKETYILVTKGRAESRVLMDGTVDLMKNFPSKRGNCPMTNDPNLTQAYRNIYSSRKRNCEREYIFKGEIIPTIGTLAAGARDREVSNARFLPCLRTSSPRTATRRSK